MEGILNFIDIKHDSISIKKLSSLIGIDCVPHIIIKGYPGSGKKTAAIAYLTEKYGPAQIKKFIMECKIPSKTDAVLLTVLYTPYYYYFNLCSYGASDKAILDSFLANIIYYKLVTHSCRYRTIIIDKADLLSHEAQQSLRRTLETKINSCRFIFIVGTKGSFIDALCSRCINIYMKSPTNKQLFDILYQIDSSLSNKKYNKIINAADRDITRGLFLLKCYTKTGVIFTKNDINEGIINISKMLLEKKHMVDIRKSINSILKLWQPDLNIILLLFKELIKANINIKKLVQLTSKYDFKLKHGNKTIYYIEGYCTEILSCI